MRDGLRSSLNPMGQERRVTPAVGKSSEAIPNRMGVPCVSLGRVTGLEKRAKLVSWPRTRHQ
eukprot:6124145-Pleurochrysis_carterae.AAC.2